MEASNSYTSKVSNTLKNAMSNIKNFSVSKLVESSNERILVIATNVILVIAIVFIIWTYSYNRTLESKECKKFASIYPDLDGALSSIDVTKVSKDASNNFAYFLNEYYIKTAYNACSLGPYKNNVVSLCMLQYVLRQGVRGLDFELYSNDDMPIVATSMDKNFHVKETFNFVPFANVLQALRDYAFSSTGSPNPNDPIVLHLRIQSTNVKMFNNLAKLFNGMGEYMLGRDYSFENKGRNLGKIQLLNFKQKIIVIVDKSNSSFMESDALKEYVNMTSNSVFMRAVRYTQGAKFSPDADELRHYNKQNMTIVLPDDTADPTNPSGILCRDLGCQMTAMRYQLPDANLKEDANFYSRNGHAFVLKPKQLRYIPTFIKKPSKPDKALSYAPRDLKATDGLYDFDI